MSILHDRFINSTNEVITQYQIFHATLRDTVRQAQVSQKKLSHDAVTHELLSKGGYQIGSMMRKVGKEYFAAINIKQFERTAKIGYRPDSESDNLRQFISQRYGFARDNIEAQMRRDLHKAYDNYRRELLEQHTSFSFQYRDAMGRARDAEGYVRVEINWMFFDAWNTGMVYTLREDNQTEAIVDRPGHEKHNRRFMLNDYEQIKDRWFHPQANALVMPVPPV